MFDTIPCDPFSPLGLHRRQPGDGGVSGGARRGRQQGGQRGLDPAPRHRLLRLPQHCQVSLLQPVFRARRGLYDTDTLGDNKCRYLNHCCGSGYSWIRIDLAVLDPDPGIWNYLHNGLFQTVLYICIYEFELRPQGVISNTLRVLKMQEGPFKDSGPKKIGGKGGYRTCQIQRKLVKIVDYTLVCWQFRTLKTG